MPTDDTQIPDADGSQDVGDDVENDTLELTKADPVPADLEEPK